MEPDASEFAPPYRPFWGAIKGLFVAKGLFVVDKGLFEAIKGLFVVDKGLFEAIKGFWAAKPGALKLADVVGYSTLGGVVDEAKLLASEVLG